jgi:hypothetical protein
MNDQSRGPVPFIQETRHESTPQPAPEVVKDQPQETMSSVEIAHKKEKERGSDEAVDGLTSEDETYEHEKEEQKQGPSIFQPAAGTPGYRPRHWDKRHKRSESPQDFWLRKPWEK